VQVDPVNPMVKAPGAKRLRLKFDQLLSRFAFIFNLRRYTEVIAIKRDNLTILEGHRRHDLAVTREAHPQVEPKP